MRYLVTGGLGFIGSAVVRSLCQEKTNKVYVIDKKGYASDIRNISLKGNVFLYNIDLTDSDCVTTVLEAVNPEYIIHLAAESHVDNSISSPKTFIDANIIGTFNILEAIRKMGERSMLQRMLHVSTDEVYGDLGAHGIPFTEDTPYEPSSPYSASKAASDHLVKAWHRTYGIPVVVTNCSNNFGAYQHPEKLIPRVITNIILGKQIPVYGNGLQVRDWLFVDDHVDALLRVLTAGEVGETYNIGSRNPRTNIDVIYMICDYMDAVYMNSSVSRSSSLITRVNDRPGHDTRYEINPDKLEKNLSWYPKITFEESLYQTIDWYVNNKAWWIDKV